MRSKSTPAFVTVIPDGETNGQPQRNPLNGLPPLPDNTTTPLNATEIPYETYRRFRQQMQDRILEELFTRFRNGQ